MIGISILLKLIFLYLVRLWNGKLFSKLIFQLGGDTATAAWWYAIISLPGVLLHEMAHFLLAILVGLRTGSISLLPKLTGEGGVELGSVQVESSDPFRGLIVGFAPFVFGTGVIMYFTHLFFPSQFIFSSWTQLLGCYLLTVISAQFFPSQKDLSLWPVIVAVLAVAIWFIRVVGFPWAGWLRIVSAIATISPLLDRGLLAGVIGNSLVLVLLILLQTIMKVIYARKK